MEYQPVGGAYSLPAAQRASEEDMVQHIEHTEGAEQDMVQHTEHTEGVRGRHGTAY